MTNEQQKRMRDAARGRVVTDDNATRTERERLL